MQIYPMIFSGRRKKTIRIKIKMNFLLYRELCDGLHCNMHLNKFDLRLSGNALESFIHEHASDFASIPYLTALDITACGMSRKQKDFFFCIIFAFRYLDLDNEIPTLLTELKKNRKLKTLYLGKNFNNIKAK